MLLAALLTAAVAIALVLTSSNSSGVVHARTVIAHDVNDAVNQVQQLISENTK